jgi:hypothetical protein
MRKMRVAALGIAAAVAAGALYQLPASPFARNGYPERPAANTSSDPGPSQNGRAQNESGGAENQPASSDPGTKVSPKTTSAPGGPAEQITYPQRGNVRYSVLPGNPATIGKAGTLRTFQIAIEGGIKGVDRTAFANFVRATYAAPQGWASGGLWRFRQVGPGQAADFTLMLVTPSTRDTICGGGPDRYTSCRIGDRVVLNVARWVRGVPNYGAPLPQYRQYMINHETGHRLGRGHELCRAAGQPAPVMQQQTLGLHGCTAYAWPYLGHARYQGRLGKYDDPIPSS